MKILYMLNRKFFIIVFILTTIFSLIFFAPASLLRPILYHYSLHKLSIKNTSGSLWSGKGLLVAYSDDGKHSSPLVLLNWRLSFGFTVPITLTTYVGNTVVANILVHFHNILVRSINLSLPLHELTNLFSIIYNMGLFGSIAILGNNLQLHKGIVHLNLFNLSSTYAPVNPIGSYDVVLDLSNLHIKVSTIGNSILRLHGAGYTNSLILEGLVDNRYDDKFRQLMYMMSNKRHGRAFLFKVI